MSGRFTQNNQGFTCSHCRREVLPASSTSRNHCPFCLYSRHVDDFPGDRQNPCKGLMRPLSYAQRGNKGWSILFECESCGHRGWNIALLEDTNSPDNYQEILKLSGSYQSRV